MHERRFNGGVDRLRSPERVSVLEIDKVIKLSLDGIKIESLLDIGTGSALFAEEFAKQNIKVSGIDVSEEMISAAKSYVPNGDFRLAPAEKIPFTDKVFDASFFGVVLHEADDMQKALNEALRVSRERILILEWPYKAGEFGPPLEHRIKPEIINDLFNKAGFNNYDKIELQNLDLYRLNI